MAQVGLSKSKYAAYCQCPKLLWLSQQNWTTSTSLPAIPQFKGTKPYQQIPFQYSLHIQYEPCGPVDHNEFLAINGQNPLRDIAEYCCLDTYAMVKVLGKLYMSCGLPKSQSSSCK